MENTEEIWRCVDCGRPLHSPANGHGCNNSPVAWEKGHDRVGICPECWQRRIDRDEARLVKSVWHVKS